MSVGKAAQVGQAGNTPRRRAQSEMPTPACLNSERALLNCSAQKEVACCITQEMFKNFHPCKASSRIQKIFLPDLLNFDKR
jgi:predicted secreted protein